MRKIGLILGLVSLSLLASCSSDAGRTSLTSEEAAARFSSYEEHVSNQSFVDPTKLTYISETTTGDDPTKRVEYHLDSGAKYYMQDEFVTSHSKQWYYAEGDLLIEASSNDDDASASQYRYLDERLFFEGSSHLSVHLEAESCYSQISMVLSMSVSDAPKGSENNGERGYFHENHSYAAEGDLRLDYTWDYYSKDGTWHKVGSLKVNIENYLVVSLETDRSYIGSSKTQHYVINETYRWGECEIAKPDLNAFTFKGSASSPF